MISNIINEEGAPVEIAPGHGNLRLSSLPFNIPIRRGMRLVNRHVSFAQIVAQQSMIGACINWELRQSKLVPLKAYRRNDDGSAERLRPNDHRLAAAINHPWEGGAQVQLVAHLLGSYLTHGNAVAPVDEGAKGVLRFGVPDWRYVLPIMPWRDVIAGWEIDTDQADIRRTLGADTVLYIREWSPISPLGLSPLEQLGATIAIEDAAQRHQRAMLTNGARPPSAIEASKEFLGLRPDERKEMLDNLRSDVDEIYAGPENSGRPALLPPGLEWKQVGHTAVEAQLIEQRVVNRTEAIGVYGLTPCCVGVIERGAELPEQRQMAITGGLAPPLILIESLINSQIAVALLKEEDVFVEFDFAGILRGDKLREIEALRQAISTALMNPEEGRGVLNLPPTDLPEMKRFYLPRNNLIPVDVPYQPNGAAVGGEAGDSEGE